MDRKPPLAVSPRRLRPRRPPISLPPIPPPTAKTTRKPHAQFSNRHSIASETPLRHNYPIYSTELTAPTKKAKQESAASLDPLICEAPLFERGRFYDAYSALRNDRLKRKMMEYSKEDVEEDVPCFPERTVEVSKKRVLKRVLETPRKSAPSDFSVSRTSTLRSSAIRKTNPLKVCSSGFSAMSSPNVGKKMLTRSALRKATSIN